jgi:hypothetical protein
MIDTADFVLPAYWASYLVNGDASGLQDGEQEEIDHWVDARYVDAHLSADGTHTSYKTLAGCLNVSEESHFSYWNDANTGLGGDVLTYTFALSPVREVVTEESVTKP